MMRCAPLEASRSAAASVRRTATKKTATLKKPGIGKTPPGPESRLPAAISNPCPPMPPPGMAGVGVCFFGSSATIALVVMSRPAIEAASCSAVRTTLVGSMMPYGQKLKS